MEIISTNFSPSALVYNVHSIIYSQAADKNLSFILNMNPEIKPVLLGDETRLRQVLINLIGNAIKFTENGTIQLTVSLLSENENRQILRFEVEDSSIGMSEEFITKLFDKFSQEQNTSNRKYEGTGLGMAISRDLIELMGSKLIVKSTKSVGTTFSFDLDLEIGNNENLVIMSPQVKENVFKNKKALLVEDNEMNRFIAIQSLSYLGFEVIEAENGKIAIDKVSSFEFDLILMDIQMPVMDGLEATGYIRNQLKNNTPIIALTANAFKHDIELYMSKGMNDYIIKP
ncbi:MAG: ATP-binding protein [Flavobacterium sp.]